MNRYVGGVCLAGANFGFLNPPPEFLVTAMVPAEYSSKAPKGRRQLADAAAKAGEEAVEEEEPPSDLPDPNESGNQAFLRKNGGLSADEFFIGTILGVILTPIFMSAVYVSAACRLQMQNLTKIANLC